MIQREASVPTVVAFIPHWDWKGLYFLRGGLSRQEGSRSLSRMLGCNKGERLLAVYLHLKGTEEVNNDGLPRIKAAG